LFGCSSIPAIPARSSLGNWESFFNSLKSEFVHSRNFNAREEAKAAIFEFIEIFDNRQRLHQTLDYVSPIEFEHRAGVS
jgi:putative transposase